MTKLIHEMVQKLEEEISRTNELLPPEDQRFGGYLCAYAINDGGPPFLIAKVGCPNPTKRAKYFEFCQEKASRLFACSGSHVSSWQTRNPNKDQYGGAIKTPDFILSFSGLTEKADEAILVVYAFKHGMLSGSAAEEIKRISQNNLIQI